MANLLVFSLIFLATPLIASTDIVDHGSYGQLFVIEEESFLSYLKLQMEKKGEKSLGLVREYLQRKVSNPAPVLENLECRRSRTFYFDPAIVLQKDIRNERGEVIASKGTRINPLDSFSFGEELLFFDGDNPRHVAWAEEEQGKWILVSGSPFQLEKEKARAVYFDQAGYLLRKLGIESVPARVTQEGKLLRIEELALPGRV